MTAAIATRAVASKGATSTATKGATAKAANPTPPKGPTSGSSSTSKSGGGSKAADATGGLLAETAPGKAQATAKKIAAKTGGGLKSYASRGTPHKLIVAEFIACIVMVALSPLTDEHKADGPVSLMRRISAVMILFLILALIGAGGKKPAKVAAGLGGLVTVSLLVSSRSVFVVLAKKFNDRSDPAANESTGPGGGAGVAPIAGTSVPPFTQGTSVPGTGEADDDGAVAGASFGTAPAAPAARSSSTRSTPSSGTSIPAASSSGTSIPNASGGRNLAI